MKRRTTRSILLAIVSMWLVGLWAMNVGATTPASLVAQPTPCLPGGPPPPVGCPPSSASPSGSGSPSSTGSPSSSPSPSESPEPEDSKSTISIKYSKKQFSGAVKSSNDCETGRNVTLKKVKGGKARTVGKTKTVAGGKWKVGYPEPGGKKYYAKVKTSTAKSGGTCKGAKSKTIKA